MKKMKKIEIDRWIDKNENENEYKGKEKSCQSVWLNKQTETILF